ncbi:MAG: hypothetical protein WC527_02960 [Candidatus Margulisiibacteriota bacterium]
MNRIRFFSRSAVLLLFFAASFSIASAQSKQPTQKEVAEYIKLIDAKITFNKAQHNPAKVKQLQAEKNRTLSRWKSLKNKNVAATKVTAKKAALKPASAKPAVKKTTAKKASFRMPTTQQEVTAYIYSVDPQIAAYKAQGDVAKAKALKAQKQKVMKNWQAIKLRQAKQKKAASKTKAVSLKQTNLEGAVGTWLNNGHTAFRVVKTEFKDSNTRGQKPPEGTRFFVVTAEIINKDPFTAVYGGDYHRVMVIDTNRVYYMENLAKNAINWADNEDIKELMTGETIQIAYVFTLPSEAQPDKLVFDASAADKYPVMRVLLR